MRTYSDRQWTRFVLSAAALVFAVLIAFGLFIPAEAVEIEGCNVELDLTVRELDQQENSVMFLSKDCYYLLLDGEILATADDEATLSDLVYDVIGEYINEKTVTCYLQDPEQLSLCYGMISVWAAEDLEQAAQALREQMKVITINRVETQESIPFQSFEVEDPEKYEDEEPEVTGGVEGVRRVSLDTYCCNGEAIQTVVVGSEVLSEPVDEVTTVGTKVRVEYIWPVEGGRISSRFGPRHIAVGSRNHKGLDIAVPKGTEVHAAKAGTVVCSGWSGGYGYLIKIDHCDGTMTYYGHNSELIAQEGDWVEQGDLIALAGSTGRSSGPHCHFEIRIDDIPMNPEEFLIAGGNP